MKIEKISSNQIRCTLTSEDFSGLDMKMSELAYGSDKAKRLFRDMLIKARNECGFDADNMPLMIEAIPTSSDTLILVITKVEDPEELDTRFSKFTPTLQDGHAPADLTVSGADDIINLYRKAQEARSNLQKLKAAAASQAGQGAASAAQSAGKGSRGKAGKDGDLTAVSGDGDVDFIRLYTFDDLDTIIKVAGVLKDSYRGVNSLYRSHSAGTYLLAAHKSGHSPEDFNRVCNILSEYGRVSECSPAAEAHLREHEEVILKDTALLELSALA